MKDKVILYRCGTHWGENPCCDKTETWVATPLHLPPRIGGHIDTEVPPGQPPAPASLGYAYGREIVEREPGGGEYVESSAPASGEPLRFSLPPAPASVERCEFCGATEPADRRLYGNINDRYPCVGKLHNTPPREGGGGKP